MSASVVWTAVLPRVTWSLIGWAAAGIVTVLLLAVLYAVCVLRYEDCQDRRSAQIRRMNRQRDDVSDAPLTAGIFVLAITVAGIATLAWGLL